MGMIDAGKRRAEERVPPREAAFRRATARASGARGRDPGP